MKKIGFVMGMAVILPVFAMVLAGCASKPFVYDESVLPENSSTLVIKECQIVEFDGKKVDLNWNAGVGEKTVIIPAGTHTLDIWASASSNMGTKLEYGNVEMTHTFLPGRSYLILAKVDDGMINGQIVNIPSIGSDLVPNIENPATPLEGFWKNTADDSQLWIFANNEFMIKKNGDYVSCGTFVYKGNSVTVYYSFRFTNRKWVSFHNSISINFNYSDKKLVYNGKEYQGTTLIKVE